MQGVKGLRTCLIVAAEKVNRNARRSPPLKKSTPSNANWRQNERDRNRGGKRIFQLRHYG